MRVRISVLSHDFSRREAIALGAGAAALVVLRHPVAALAGGATAFELALPEAGAFTAGAGWRTLPVARSPRRFDLVGLRWGAGSPKDVQVRARRRGGDWSEWLHLHRLDDHAPDGARTRLATDPAWTGPADLVQFRFRGSAGGLRARFVRTPSRGLARAAARPKARQSQSGAPPIIPRSAWGGDSRPPKEDPEYGEVQLAFVHHTVTANEYAPEDSASIVLGICEYHQDHNKWNDLGYNFLVDKYGQIFEGRAGGIDQAVIGAQAQGYNSASTGIACLGDFSSLPNSDAGLEAVARLIAWKLPLHGVPVSGQVTVTSAGGSANRHPSGTPVTLERISGHRDGNRTACPGAALYGQLQRIRERAAALAVPVSVLSAKAAATRVRHSRPIALSGVLRFSDGASPAGEPVQIEYQSAGAAWSPIATTQAAADGSWSASVVLDATGALRAVFPGDAAHPRLEAAAIPVTILPVLTLALSERKIPRSGKVELTGTLGPAWPSRIPIVLEVRRGRKWVLVQRKRVNVRGGRYKTALRPRRPGLYRISAEGPGVVVRRLLRVTVAG